MEPSVLTLYKCPFAKKRLGKDGDGGYIIADIPDAQYEILLAGGILDDISFEEDFLRIHPDAKAYAFDGTIGNLPKENENIVFIRKNVGDNNDEATTNIHDIIDANDRIFVKMDIEGGEIPWILSLRNEHMSKFEQIVMEFHSPFGERENDVFNKINDTHYLVHFHGNNCCGVNNHRGVNIPWVFECTYLHKKHFNGRMPELNTEPIPSGLDMKNTWNDEIVIDYPPFVHIY